MFEIHPAGEGRIALRGRLDAAEAEKALETLRGISASTTADCSELEYISSAGLGILLKTQKRLVSAGEGLKIINVNNHIHDVFRYSGFHSIFEIETQ